REQRFVLPGRRATLQWNQQESSPLFLALSKGYRSTGSIRHTGLDGDGRLRFASVFELQGMQAQQASSAGIERPMDDIHPVCVEIDDGCTQNSPLDVDTPDVDFRCAVLARSGSHLRTKCRPERNGMRPDLLTGVRVKCPDGICHGEHVNHVMLLAI